MGLCHDVQVLIAESFGGQDEPVDVLANNLVDAGAELSCSPLRVKDMPNQALYQQFEEAGTYVPGYYSSLGATVLCFII